MDETSTSSGPASAASLAPMWTAIPRTCLAGQLDLAGVNAGAHLNAQAAVDRRRSRLAQRTARAGPSNVAKVPSPAVSTSSPAETRHSARRAWCAPAVRATLDRQPRPLDRSIQPLDEDHRRQHSVGRRYGSLARSNSSMASRMASVSGVPGDPVVAPENSISRAPGICRSWRAPRRVGRRGRQPY